MLAALPGSPRTGSAAAQAVTSGASAGKTLMDAKLGFILELPAGFVAAPDVLARNPSMLYAYALGRRDSNGVSITLMIERLGKQLRRERLQRSQIPKDVTGEIVTKEWNGFTLEVMVMEKKLGHRTYLAYVARVPLKGEAIQLELVGPTARKDELDVILRQLLDGLSGESNWSADDVAAAATPGASRDLFGVSPRAFLIGAAAVGAVAFIPLFWPRRPRRELGSATRVASSAASTSSSSSSRSMSSSSSHPPPLPPRVSSGATPPPLPSRPPPF